MRAFTLSVQQGPHSEDKPDANEPDAQNIGMRVYKKVKSLSLGETREALSGRTKGMLSQAL